MTRADQFNFILHQILPAIEKEGLTIKTRWDGEITLSANGSVAENLIQNLRDYCVAELNRPSAPPSSYGV